MKDKKIRVSERYARKIKQMAAAEGKSILKFTDELADDVPRIISKRDKFDWRF